MHLNKLYVRHTYFNRSCRNLSSYKSLISGHTVHFSGLLLQTRGGLTSTTLRIDPFIYILTESRWIGERTWNFMIFLQSEKCRHVQLLDTIDSLSIGKTGSFHLLVFGLKNNESSSFYAKLLGVFYRCWMWSVNMCITWQVK